MKILVDVDDTVIEFVWALLERYNRDFSDSLRKSDITDWNIAAFVKPECGERIYEYFSDPNVYRSASLVPGALYAILHLTNTCGHEIVYVTAADSSEKRLKLERFGLWFGEDNYIVAEDKSVVPGDILIDDRPKNVENFPGIGILFDQPWNRNFPWRLRAHDWDEVIEMVENYGKNKVIDGVGPEAPTVINENGGKQSHLDYRVDLYDPLVLLHVARILAEGGKKYGEWNWRRIPIQDHINHALVHLLAYLAGDLQDDHLGHALCRLVFALSLHLTPGDCPRMMPEVA